MVLIIDNGFFLQDYDKFFIEVILLDKDDWKEFQRNCCNIVNYEFKLFFKFE